MINIYDHNLVASLCLFMDYKLCQEYHAFYSVTGRFYRVNDAKVSGLSVYASPYKQWVYDSSIAGATVMSGVYVNGTYIERGTSGLAIDYLRGRIYLNSSITTPNVSGVYSAKEFNIIPTSTEETKLLTNTEYVNRRESLKSVSGLSDGVVPVPAIFLKHYPGKNEPYEFGGPRSTNSEARAIIMCDERDSYYLDGAMAAMRDIKHKYFGLFSPEELPFTPYGDLKSGVFNYCAMAQPKFENGDIVFVNNSYSSRFGVESSNKINFRVAAGFSDIELRFIR